MRLGRRGFEIVYQDNSMRRRGPPEEESDFFALTALSRSSRITACSADMEFHIVVKSHGRPPTLFNIGDPFRQKTDAGMAQFRF